MTEEELQRMEELEKGATGGPWTVELDDSERVKQEISAFIDRSGGRHFWCLVEGVFDEANAPNNLLPAMTGNGPTSEANANFIAAARSFITPAIAEIRRLREKIEELECNHNAEVESDWRS